MKKYYGLMAVVILFGVVSFCSVIMGLWVDNVLMRYVLIECGIILAFLCGELRCKARHIYEVEMAKRDCVLFNRVVELIAKGEKEFIDGHPFKEFLDVETKSEEQKE